MKQWFAVLSLATLPAGGWAQTPQPTFEALEAMDRECTAFLQAMPADRQHQQALAVNRAAQGDTAQLCRIRASRNTTPELPAGVEATYVRPDLCLFSPKTCALLPRPVMLYLHGGGWAFGSINSCASFCAALALRGNCCVVALNYRLSPESPYPAALDDCRSALSYIRAHATEWGCDTARISVGGDSAGGNLALALAMSDGGLYAALPIYPVTELYEVPSASWQKYAQGYGDDAELLLSFCAAYAAGQERDPFASVGLASDSLLRRLPRTLMLSAGRDILLDQGTAFVQRARRAGHQAIEQVVYPTATHLFITVPGQPTAFAEAVKLAASFVQ